MSTTDVLQKLSILAFAVEVVYRVVVAVINAVRLVVSPDYRDETFGAEYA